MGVGDQAIDFGHGGDLGAFHLGGAAGDQQAGVGARAAGAADGLARLAQGLGGDGAAVDDDEVGGGIGGEQGAQALALGEIEAAAQGDDV